MAISFFQIVLGKLIKKISHYCQPLFHDILFIYIYLFVICQELKLINNFLKRFLWSYCENVRCPCWFLCTVCRPWCTCWICTYVSNWRIIYFCRFDNIYYNFTFYFRNIFSDLYFYNKHLYFDCFKILLLFHCFYYVIKV